MISRISLVTLALLSVAAAVPVENREKKAFSLFSVVQFPNVECQPNKEGFKDLTGICQAESECSSANGGTQTGNCGLGFGKCCVYTAETDTTKTITQNLTVIQNTKFPTAVTTAAKTYTYNIKPAAETCMLRFDFVKLDLVAAATGACTDMFKITSPIGISPPVLCGKSDGQHIYSDHAMSTTDTKVEVITGAGTESRLWRVKVSQIECSSELKPPSVCGQYFFGNSGFVETFNRGTTLSVSLQSLDYQICFRAPPGMCKLALTVDESTTTPDPFLLLAAATMNKQTAANCAPGQLIVDGTVHCGAKLNPTAESVANGIVTAMANPLRVQFKTGAVTQAGTTGFRLRYSYQPC